MRALMKCLSWTFNSTSSHLDPVKLLVVWYVCWLTFFSRWYSICSLFPYAYCRRRHWVRLLDQVPSKTTTSTYVSSVIRNVTLTKWEIWSRKSLRVRVMCLFWSFFSQGFKFKHFPYILTLHLKRFDFDYSTMQRIKLNNRWVWPIMSCDIKLLLPSIVFSLEWRSPLFLISMAMWTEMMR